MKMQIFSFSFTLIFLAAYTMQGFEHSAHLTVNIMLAAFCLAGLNGILWPQSFNFLNENFCLENFREMLIINVVN